MGRWVEVSPHNIEQAPAAPGLYCAYADNRLVYIGQTRNIRARFLTHQFAAAIANGRWKGIRLCDLRLKVSQRYCDERARLLLEKRLIRRTQPVLNVIHSERGQGKANNAFAREMHLQYG